MGTTERQEPRYSVQWEIYRLADIFLMYAVVVELRDSFVLIIGY